MIIAGRIIAVFVGLTLLSTREGYAIGPKYIGDDALAAYPIIVVATWDKASVVSHNKYRNDSEIEKHVIKSEMYTKLNVRTVVKGSIKPGICNLRIGRGIAWHEDGTALSSGTSTDLPGDVDDITKPCLWFLRLEHSWDKDFKTAYLIVSNYREIQPLELKEYFVALGAADAAMQVPKLLSPDKPIVANRVLYYICGGQWPWPYDGQMFDESKRQGALLAGEADRVWALVNTDAKDLRCSAASIYAKLRGKNCVAKMRTLLDDKDPILRGIAVGILAQNRDGESLGRFPKAVEGITDAWIACKVVEALFAWKDERVVLPLMGFLQNDGLAFQYGDDLGIPALKARQALLAITGHVFPFDVNVSRKAWQAAVRTDDKTARRRLLEREAPGSLAPFVATTIGSPRRKLGKNVKDRPDPTEKDEVFVTIRLRNVITRPMTILKLPSEVEMSWPGSLASYGGGFGADARAEKQEFATVSPGQFIEFETKLNTRFLIADPSQRRLKLGYLSNGNRVGVNAWIGSMNVEFGTEWKGKREAVSVEETWPNGNLKATGKTVNGIKLGEWNYFNEQGDRIKIEYPGTGRGTATCNPEHPTNKGVGKRQSK